MAVTDDTTRHAFRINWIVLQKHVRDIGIAAFFFALGGWVVSIRVSEARLPYLESATQHFEAVQKLAGPNPIATIKCERHKSAVAESVAVTAVLSNTIPAIPSPDLDQIPDCPAPPHLSKN